MFDTSFAMPTIYAESVVLHPRGVSILDRRIFPFEKAFVECVSCEQVAVAIESMITQSNGPFYAAGGGMVLAARAAESLNPTARIQSMKDAGKRLIRTRPTNNNVASAVAAVIAFAASYNGKSSDFADSIEAFVRADWERRRAALKKVGENAAKLVPEGSRLMTYCWSEGALMETLAAVRRAGKSIELICPETRPYLQGARLTAHSAAEMGIPTTVITDGMCAHAMATGKATMLMTAADRVTMSGHVINKVGTLNAAIAARNFALPYFATVLKPDIKAATPADVEMEERDPEETLHCRGTRTASPLAKGWYPAFDVTPPHMVSGIVTERGVFAPSALNVAYPGNASDVEY